ncbi:MAG TPA: hypothetical protein VD973_23850, partial [Symbiobacteriaceae bacterium]|nr:hypothetical protein [Symbiobacteriaceae bacterium]
MEEGCPSLIDGCGGVATAALSFFCSTLAAGPVCGAAATSGPVWRSLDSPLPPRTSPTPRWVLLLWIVTFRFLILQFLVLRFLVLRFLVLRFLVLRFLVLRFLV